MMLLRFKRERCRGVTIIEYAILLMLISGASLGVMGSIGGESTKVFTEVEGNLENAVGGDTGSRDGGGVPGAEEPADGEPDTTLPDAVVGEEYTAPITYPDGIPPESPIVSVDGPVPPGLVVDIPTGTVTGTPTDPADEPFIVRVSTPDGEQDVVVLVPVRHATAANVRFIGGPGNEFDFADNIVRVSDGYIIAGHTESGPGSYKDAWIAKLDRDHNIEWQKFFSSGGNTFIHDVILDDNGNIVTVGEYDGMAWFMKFFGKSETVAFNRKYRNPGGLSFLSRFNRAVETGVGFALVGDTILSNYPDREAWLLFITMNGDVISSLVLNGDGETKISDVALYDGGDMLVGGTTRDSDADGGDLEAFVSKVTWGGTHKWTRRFDNTMGVDYIEGMTRLPDDEIGVLVKSVRSGLSRMHLVAFDDNGNVMRGFEYTSPTSDLEDPYDFVRDERNGRLFVVGKSAGDPSDPSIHAFDDYLTPISQVVFEVPYVNHITQGFMQDDGRLVFTGQAYYGARGREIMVGDVRPTVPAGAYQWTFDPLAQHPMGINVEEWVPTIKEDTGAWYVDIYGVPSEYEGTLVGYSPF